MAFGLEGSVPFPDPDINVEIRADQILKLLSIGVGKMVGVDDLGSKATDDIRRFVDRHCKGDFQKPKYSKMFISILLGFSFADSQKHGFLEVP